MIDFDDLSEPAAFQRARLAALQERADRLKALEEEQERQARERATANSLRVHKRHVLNEYRAAGVDPPLIDEHGNPIVSLSLLLKYGWSIETLGDRNLLIEPPDPPVSGRRKTREDYQNVEGS